MIRFIATGLAAIYMAGAAQAQTPATQSTILSDSAKAVIGSWEFSNADRDKICTATFKSDPTKVGFKVEFDANCANLFALVADVAGWNFPDNDLLRLLNADGKALVEFSEVEDGIYEAPPRRASACCSCRKRALPVHRRSCRSRSPAIGRSCAGPTSYCAVSRWQTLPCTTISP